MPEIANPEPPLSDGTVTLRRMGADHIPALVAACRDPLIPRFTRVPDGYGEADARAWIKESERQRKAGSG
ncbi:MAG: GNAT family N-acetyltransferase, partial [Solirubrobacterales bacterium]